MRLSTFTAVIPLVCIGQEMARLIGTTDEKAGDDPSWLSAAYLEMSERWQPIKVCMAGTQGFGNMPEHSYRRNQRRIMPLGFVVSVMLFCRHSSPE